MTNTQIQENFDLSGLNTLSVSARAEYYARIQTKNQVKQVLRETPSGKPVFVLGGGSNVLFVNDFNGLVIQPKIMEKKVVDEDENHVWLKVGAGENWHQLVKYCVRKGWGGIENLSLIPGWAGAAPIQNIGAYGVEFEEVFHSLTAVKIANGRQETFYHKDCGFGYRDSVFKHQKRDEYVITDVTIQLNKDPAVNTSYGSIRQKLDEKNISNPTIKEISEIVVEIRNHKLPDPSDIPNAGSFFKNPIVNDELFTTLKKEYPDMPFYAVDDHHTKIPAGWLVEKAGWKEKTNEKVGVYQKQALVIINKQDATGREILSLANQIQQSVAEMFGIDLAPEVNIID